MMDIEIIGNLLQKWGHAEIFWCKFILPKGRIKSFLFGMKKTAQAINPIIFSILEF
jgi:hypothetical protein